MLRPDPESVVADKWLAKHGRKTVFCLVQFKGANDHELPRMYLATPMEIAERLKQWASKKSGSGEPQERRAE
jgi:hypothetical protein